MDRITRHQNTSLAYAAHRPSGRAAWGVWGDAHPAYPRNDFNDLAGDFPHFPQHTRRNDFNGLRGDFPHFPHPDFIVSVLSERWQLSCAGLAFAPTPRLLSRL
jgi:hypothetical protein